MSQLTLILGGARSGKSKHAVGLASQKSHRVLYVATAQGLDEEMRKRISAHQENRPAAWQTLELPKGVGRHLLAQPSHTDVILLDCLTLLVSNLLLQAAADLEHPDEGAARSLVQGEITDLLQAIQAIPVHWIIVSNEVGHGLVPPNPVGRVFRDLLGCANQRLAEKADEVLWMVAGIPVPIGQYRA